MCDTLSHCVCSCVNIQLDDSAFVDNDGFRTSVMSLEPESGHNSNLGDFAGGWHVILPTSKEDHLKLFEVIAPHAICVVLMKLFKKSNWMFICLHRHCFHW